MVREGGGLDVVDAGGDVQLFGHHVMGRHGVGVGRGAQQLAGIGLEVEAFVDADHRGPAREIHALGAVEGKGCASARLQADGLHAALLRNLISPGACGIHQRARAQLATVGQGQVPVTAFARGDAQLRIALQHTTGTAHGAQEALVQCMHVQIAGVGFEHRANHCFRVQARHQRERMLGIDQRHIASLCCTDSEGLFQQSLLPLACDIQATARLQQRMLGEISGRLLIESAAGAGQGLDLRCSVTFHEHGCGAAGGVIARLALALEHHDPGLPSQAIGQRGPRNTAANDGEIETFAVVHTEVPPVPSGRSNVFAAVLVILRYEKCKI